MIQDVNSHPPINDSHIKQNGIQYGNSTAEYGEHIKNTAAICNSSVSHTYGHIIGIVEKYILDKLGIEDKLKTVTASTELSSRQIKHTPRKLYKKECPMLVMVPHIKRGYDDRFLGNTIYNRPQTYTHATWGYGSLMELAHDRKNNIYVHGKFSRELLNIDFIFSFNTPSEQMNWTSMMMERLLPETPQEVIAPIEFYLPESAVQLISGLSKIPVEDNSGSVYNFTTYMNSIFSYPITYKLKGGSNRDEFFMYELTTMDITPTIPDDSSTGVKIGQIRTHFDVSFTVKCEFNSISFFKISSPDINTNITLPDESSDTISTIFTDQINLDDFQLPFGWSILSWPIFKLEIGKDSISLAPIMNYSIQAVIQHHLKFNIPMERFIRIQFRENGQILDQERYYIDWNKMELHLLNPNYHRTYRLLITISHDYINNLVKDIYGLE